MTLLQELFEMIRGKYTIKDLVKRLRAVPKTKYAFPPVHFPDHEEGTLYVGEFKEGEIPPIDDVLGQEKAAGFYWVFELDEVKFHELELEDIVQDFHGPFASEKEAIEDFETGSDN